MKKYNTLIFDLDNTLFDYDKASQTALVLTLEYMGVTSDFEQIYKSYAAINDKLWNDLENDLITSENLRTERFRQLGKLWNFQHTEFEAAGAFYLDKLSQQTQMYSDTIPTLDALRSEYELGILTNGIAEVQRSRMKLSGISHYFKALIISSEHNTAKPDPEIFRIACEMMNADRSEILYIGDSVSSDMEGARRAGIDFCWFNPTENEPDRNDGFRYKIRKLGEIPVLLADSMNC